MPDSENILGKRSDGRSTFARSRWGLVRDLESCGGRTLQTVSWTTDTVDGDPDGIRRRGSHGMLRGVCQLCLIAFLLVACGSDLTTSSSTTTAVSDASSSVAPTIESTTIARSVTTTSAASLDSTTELPPTTDPSERELGTTLDGRFTYYAQLGDGRVGSRWVITVDADGERVRALRDDRDEFDQIEQFVFGDDGLVGWVWADYNFGYRAMVGRIDVAGRIVDTHPLHGRARAAFEDDPSLAPIIADPGAFGLDLESDPFAVMSANPAVLIQTETPLIPELETEGAWARDDAGSWYRGETLGNEPACGGSTLYKDDADGFARVLTADIELDTVVEVHASEANIAGHVDTAGVSRFVVLSTECPELYEGLRVFVGKESVNDGDGGPRWEFPLSVEPLSDFEVTHVTGIETTSVGNDDCCGQTRVSIHMELLDGQTETILWPRSNDMS